MLQLCGRAFAVQRRAGKAAGITPRASHKRNAARRTHSDGAHDGIHVRAPQVPRKDALRRRCSVNCAPLAPLLAQLWAVTGRRNDRCWLVCQQCLCPGTPGRAGSRRASGVSLAPVSGRHGAASCASPAPRAASPACLACAHALNLLWCTCNGVATLCDFFRICALAHGHHVPRRARQPRAAAPPCATPLAPRRIARSWHA